DQFNRSRPGSHHPIIRWIRPTDHDLDHTPDRRLDHITDHDVDHSTPIRDSGGRLCPPGALRDAVQT
ncbi:MAG: hypothetical protein KGJ86_16595, partial [Chloroflexota bacterium]|nr:hypothetical protein [Chloroflexota bacterium]